MKIKSSSVVCGLLWLALCCACEDSWLIGGPPDPDNLTPDGGVGEADGPWGWIAEGGSAPWVIQQEAGLDTAPEPGSDAASGSDAGPPLGYVAAQDDTLSCANTFNVAYGGPTVVLDKAYDYQTYHNRDAYTDGTTFHALKASWKQQVQPKLLSEVPVLIGPAGPPTNGDGPSFCWIGGVIDGTNDLDETWCKMYVGHNTGMIAAGKMPTITGVRLDNVFDGFNVSETGIGNFTIKNCWVSYNRDDAIENDGMRPGVIEDNLFDGVFVLYSAVNTGSSYNGSGNTVVVRRNLVHLEQLPGIPHYPGGTCYPDKPGYGGLFKMWDNNAPKIALHDNIFMLDPKAPSGSTWVDLGIGNKLVSCSGNTLVWLGDGGAPDPSWSALNATFPGCVTITKDKTLFEKAKANWINCHPQVGRVPDDPSPNLAGCDHAAAGGS
jgi:hypothetical protein